MEAVKKALGVLDAHLAQRTFLVGHAVTLADIVASANLYHGFTKVGLAADAACKPCWGSLRAGRRASMAQAQRRGVHVRAAV